MEKDETILKEAEEEAKRIHDLEAPSTSVPPVVENTPKKGGNGKDIIIIVLIVLLVLAGVVILFATGVVGGKTKNSNKNSEKQNVVENTEKTNTENVEKPVDTPKYKEKQLTIDSNEVQALYDLFAGSIQNEEKDDYTIKMKATIRYINLTDIQTKTCGELSNYKYQFEGEYETYFCNTGDISNISYPWGYNEPIELTPEGIEQVNNTSVKTVTLEKFNETYKKLFGTDPVEEPKSFRNGCVSIVYYDEVNKLYALDFLLPNAGCSGYTSVNLDSFTQENGNLILHVIRTGDETENIDITFKFDDTTGNYIFVSITE